LLLTGDCDQFHEKRNLLGSSKVRDDVDDDHENEVKSKTRKCSHAVYFCITYNFFLDSDLHIVTLPGDAMNAKGTQQEGKN
jgi:hypothetical protein